MTDHADGVTHWEGCEAVHHACALEMLASSQIALRQAMDDRTALRAEREEKDEAVSYTEFSEVRQKPKPGGFRCSSGKVTS